MDQKLRSALNILELTRCYGIESIRQMLRIPVNATPDSGGTRHPIPVEGDTLTVTCG